MPDLTVIDGGGEERDRDREIAHRMALSAVPLGVSGIWRRQFDFPRSHRLPPSQPCRWRQRRGYCFGSPPLGYHALLRGLLSLFPALSLT